MIHLSVYTGLAFPSFSLLQFLTQNEKKQSSFIFLLDKIFQIVPIICPVLENRSTNKTSGRKSERKLGATIERYWGGG